MEWTGRKKRMVGSVAIVKKYFIFSYSYRSKALKVILVIFIVVNNKESHNSFCYCMYFHNTQTNLVLLILKLFSLLH